jgi:MbtH protein
MADQSINETVAEEADFLVVVNAEEQYSIWVAERDLPLGWRAEGTRGSKEACLAHIEKIWTDIRPLSVRQGMASGTAREV